MSKIIKATLVNFCMFFIVSSSRRASLRVPAVVLGGNSGKKLAREFVHVAELPRWLVQSDYVKLAR
jgi:hypothetical protein